MNNPLAGIAMALAACCAGACIAQPSVPPSDGPPGLPKSGKTRALEVGAQVLQSSRPLARFDIYLVGFHPMKDDPEHQMEAHHYCSQVNEDFAQCVLFDGNTKDANMNGVEYIISERLFETLPDSERHYWHPHNGEILSGQLVAPGIPAVAEKALMKSKMNSYGKTWHMWNSSGPGHDRVPLGMPMLAWSFNRDGEAAPGLVEARDRAMHIDSEKIRNSRAGLSALAKPQAGVDDLKGKFPRATRTIPGVTAK